MSSGITRVIYNSLERLISEDANRAQSMLAAGQQEAWRARYGTPSVNFRTYPGLQTQATTIGVPSYGEVYSGLMVRPDADAVASLYVTVDEGVAMITDPLGGGEASSFDSSYIFCRDPGCPAGVLNFVANATPSTVRWDVIECQPIDTLVISTSVDQYNPATGLFAPVTLDKVRTVRLTYRLRQGVAGTGFPGSAAGWLPLAVVAVRDGVTSFAQCDFYDVRPLVADRVQPQAVSSAGNEGYSPFGDGHYTCRDDKLFGFAESEFGGYLAGGALRPTACFLTANFGSTDESTGASAPDFCVTHNANQGSGYSVTGDTISYIAALFPKDPVTGIPLPRWARYSQFADPVQGRRVPNGTRGILVVTNSKPGENGLFGSIGFPAASQLGVDGCGVLIAICTARSASPVSGNFARRRFTHAIPMTLAAGTNSWSIAGDTGLNYGRWTLLPGVHFPPNARAIYVSMFLAVTYTIQTSSIEVSSRENSSERLTIHLPTRLTASSGTLSPINVDPVIIERPVLRDVSFPLVGDPPLPWDIDVYFPQTDAGRVVGFAGLFIHGWEF
jgi:hypothetical protein